MEEQMRNDEIEINLIELFHALMKKLWLIILCLIVGAVAMGGYTKFFITPQYQASSMIYILGRETNISGVNLQLSQQLTVDFETLAKSRPVIERVIEKLDLSYSYSEVSSMITVENPTDTSILKMIVTNPDPELAADIANQMADATADRVAEVMVTDKPSTVEDAVVPTAPVSPNLKKNIMIGGLAGAVLAAGVVTLLFLMDDTLKSEEDIRRYLGLNTLAAVPREKKRKRAEAV